MSCVVGGHLKLDLVAHDVGAHLLAGLHLGWHNHLQLYRGMQKKNSIHHCDFWAPCWCGISRRELPLSLPCPSSSLLTLLASICHSFLSGKTCGNIRFVCLRIQRLFPAVSFYPEVRYLFKWTMRPLLPCARFSIMLRAGSEFFSGQIAQEHSSVVLNMQLAWLEGRGVCRPGTRTVTLFDSKCTDCKISVWGLDFILKIYMFCKSSNKLPYNP